ncbi:MAG: hypothetical protein DMG28_03245 [Acidobacteria bacterium]|nr:MAG: hypothetical protein DMG28_03245 [Acidobacteriota bacterium]
MQAIHLTRNRICPACGSAEAHRSKRRGLFELVILRLLFLRPYRCEDCGTRHYRFTAVARA